MTKLFRSLLTGITLLIAGSAQAQAVISTYAGTPVTGGYDGNGGPAIEAKLSSPSDIVFDKAGNLYIADFLNNVIRKVDTFGVITNFAGTGFGAGSTSTASGAYSGDGGPATAADLNGPFAIAIDKQGSIIFADGYNHVVRKVTTAGTITTIAGNHIAGYSGDGGPATAAAMNNPVGLAIDTANNIYIADDHNNVIRKVTPAGIISTFAGDSTAGYAGDGGPATTALLNNPLGVAVDSKGNVYIADVNNMVRKVDTAGIIHPYAGNIDTAHGYSGDGGPALSGKLYNPAHMGFDDTDNLYISDALNNVVRKVSPEGNIYTFAGTGLPGFGNEDERPDTALMFVPYAVAINFKKEIFIADRGNQIIRRVGKRNTAAAGHISTAAAGMQVYPNPVTNGAVSVAIHTAAAEQATLTISNVLGQIIATQQITTNTTAIVKMSLPKGVYFIHASGPTCNRSTEVVVE